MSAALDTALTWLVYACAFVLGAPFLIIGFVVLVLMSMLVCIFIGEQIDNWKRDRRLRKRGGA